MSEIILRRLFYFYMKKKVLLIFYFSIVKVVCSFSTVIHKSTSVHIAK